jgi:ribose 5-phosphate isomerase RpiB
VKIALAADHAGVDLKDKVAEILTSKGHEKIVLITRISASRLRAPWPPARPTALSPCA